MKTIILALLAILFPVMAAAADKPLTLWAHPYLPTTELSKRLAPLAEYLSKAIDRPVEIRVQKSYQAHIEFVGHDLADIAYMGPASFVQMRAQYGHKPLLAKLDLNGKPYYRGVIITRRDSPLKSLADLAGKSFAFGDPNSTMSHVVPKAMLIKAGISLDKLARHDYLSSHHDVALAVLGGYFDAGAIKEEVFAVYQARGLKALAHTPPIPSHLFVARADLPAELITRLRAALLAINENPAKKEIIGALEGSATGLLPVKDRDYQELRILMGQLK